MKERIVQRLIEFIDDWGFMIRRDGWRMAMWTTGRELAQLPLRRVRFVVLARSLVEPLPSLKSKVALDIRQFEPADLDWVRQTNRPSEAKLCARRLDHGQFGLLALHGGQPAGYAWAYENVEPALERVHLQLRAGDAVCIDAYTAPEARGKGVQTALALGRCQALRNRGFTRAVVYIEHDNYPSLAVWQKKLNSRVIGYLDFCRIGPWRRVRYWDETAEGPVQLGNRVV